MRNTVNRVERAKTIGNGKGIQNILNEARKILGNPLVMFNTEYNLLAYTNDIENDPISKELVAYGTFSYETQKFFMEEGFGDDVANTKNITFLNSEKLKYDRIYGKLFDKNNIHVANLIMVACNKPFEEGDQEAFEIICERVSKEIIKNEFFQTYGMMYQETYIRKLIEGNIKEKGIYTAHISIIYNDLKDNLHLAVADIAQCDPEHTKLCYFRDMFKQIQPMFKYSIYNNQIIILINTDETLNIERDLNKLNEIFEQHNIYAGISGCFENLFELQKYYAEAVDVLNHGLRTGSQQRIFIYESLSSL